MLWVVEVRITEEITIEAIYTHFLSFFIISKDKKDKKINPGINEWDQIKWLK